MAGATDVSLSGSDAAFFLERRKVSSRGLSSTYCSQPRLAVASPQLEGIWGPRAVQRQDVLDAPSR